MFRPAHIYGLIYKASGKDYAAEAREIDEQIRSRIPAARSLLDTGCGTGGHLRHLREFYEAMGVDIDPAMLAEARAPLPGINVLTLFSDEEYRDAFVGAGLQVETVGSPTPGRDRYIGQAKTA